MLGDVRELMSENMEYLKETTDQFFHLKKEADKLIRYIISKIPKILILSH